MKAGLKIINYCILILLLFGVSSCSCGGGGGVRKLDTPTGIEIYNNFLMWDDVADNKGYILSINDEEQVVYTNEFDVDSFRNPGIYYIKIKAKGDNNNYRSSDYSEVITHTIETYNRVCVTFDYNDGKTSNKKVYTHFNTCIEEPENPTRKGYRFVGWKTSYSYWDFEYNIIYNEITLYAEWEPYYITISFNTNGGYSYNTYPIYKYTGDIYGTLPTAIKTGSIFLGWYNSSNQKITESSIVVSEKDITLIAKWSEGTSFTLTFDSKGGTECHSIVVTYGDTYWNLPTTEKEGYLFLGWRNSGYEMIENGDTVNITKDTIFYATWTELTKTRIIFSEGTDEILYRKIGEKYGTLPTLYTSSGLFVGWANEDSLKVSSSTIVNRLDVIKLYPIWYKSGKMVLTYYLYDNQYEQDHSRNPGTQYGQLWLPTRYGYEFEYWYKIIDGVERKVTQDCYILNSLDNELYAKWREIDGYTITFDANEGTCDTEELFVSIKNQVGEIKLPEANKLYATFIGWKDEEGGAIYDGYIDYIYNNLKLTALYLDMPTDIFYSDKKLYWKDVYYAANYRIEIFHNSNLISSLYAIYNSIEVDLEKNIKYDIEITAYSHEYKQIKSAIFTLEIIDDLVDITYEKDDTFLTVSWENPPSTKGKYNLYTILLNDRQYSNTIENFIKINYSDLLVRENEIKIYYESSNYNHFEDVPIKFPNTPTSANISNHSEPIYITKLASPDWYLNNNFIAWDQVNNVSIYEYQNLKTEEYSDTTNRFIKNIAAGKFSYKVRSIASSENEVNSDWIEIIGTKLEKPVLFYSDGILYWNYIDNAESYELIDNTGTRYSTNVSSFLMNDITNISIQAIARYGAGIYYLNSDVEVYQSIVLDTPRIYFDNYANIVHWNRIDDANYYTIVINNEFIEVIDTSYFINPLLYNNDLTIYVNANHNQYIESRSDSITIKFIEISFDTRCDLIVSSIRGFDEVTCYPITLQRDDLVFRGWSLKEDGSEIISKVYTTKKSVNLYAVWEESLDFKYSEIEGGYEISVKDKRIEGEIIIPRTINGKPVLRIKDFSSCYFITSIIIPDTVIEIGNAAFKNNISLVSITIPASVLKIKDEAFWGCNELKDVELNAGLIEIGSKAFAHNTVLQDLFIPATVATIGSDLFTGCSDLIIYFTNNTKLDYLKENYAVYENVKEYGTNGNFRYIINSENKLIITKYIGSKNEVIIPTLINNYNVIEIGKKAFYQNSLITKVTFENSVVNIGEYAFYECTSLKEIELPESLKYLSEYSFAYTSIEYLIIPKNTLIIYECAFLDCLSLKYIYIPISVKAIEKNAFVIAEDGTIFCQGLSSLPAWDDAFTTCTKIIFNCPDIEDIMDLIKFY